MGETKAMLPALREWAATCEAVGRGEQAVLIRKGGIAEGAEGFAVESARFALLPTLFHESKGEAAGGPAVVSVLCEVVATKVVAGTADVSALTPFHRYAPEQLASRLAYRPDRPLTVIAVRAFRLREPVQFAAEVVRPVCRSWLGLPVDAGRLALDAVVRPFDEGALLRAVQGMGEG